MGQDAYMGMCVTSHATGTTTVAAFDKVTFGSQTNNLLRDRMLGVNASVWVRAEFDAEETAFFDSLRLQDAVRGRLCGLAQRHGSGAGEFHGHASLGLERPTATAPICSWAIRPCSTSPGTRACCATAATCSRSRGSTTTRPIRCSWLRRSSMPPGRSGSRSTSSTPTPGRTNVSGAVDLVATPELSHERGFYSASFPLSIFCDTPGATIRYTTNGTKPTEVSGLTYTGPITISTTTCLRVAAFKPGWMSSPVQTHTYHLPRQGAAAAEESARLSGDCGAPPPPTTRWTRTW